MTSVRTIVGNRRFWLLALVLIAALTLPLLFERGLAKGYEPVRSALPVAVLLALGLLALWAVSKNEWLEFLLGLALAALLAAGIAMFIRTGWLDSVLGSPQASPALATVAIRLPGAKVHAIGDGTIPMGKVLVVIVERHHEGDNKDTIETKQVEGSLSGPYVPGADPVINVERGEDGAKAAEVLGALADAESIYIMTR